MNVVEQIFWNLVAVRSGLVIERIKEKKNIVKNINIKILKKKEKESRTKTGLTL